MATTALLNRVVECGEPIKHFHRMQDQWLRVPEERVGV